MYICEKSSVGRALAGVLPGEKRKDDNFIRCGDDIVAWASGHLLELCEPEDYDERYKKWTRDTLLYVPEKWKLREKERTKALFAGLRKLIKALSVKTDVIVNVGDADREGELLICEILDYCGWTGTTKRLRLNDVNPEAIRRALNNIRDNSEYQGEYRAGQARMYADWLVGLALTRFVTVSLREAGYDVKAMSVGRVQTPTLGLVVTRDREIENFSPSLYYELTAALSFDDKRNLKGRWIPGDACSNAIDGRKRITDREIADSLTKKLDGATGSIVSVTKKKHSVASPLPFSLSKLQIAASKKYDITDTLAHVQKLYEAGYVSYPRTSCEYIPEGHFAEAGKIIEAIRSGCPGLSDMIGGVDLNRKGPAWNDKKITEHHAIIPTARAPREGALSGAERKIHELICARYVLQFLQDYEYEETVVDFEAGGEVFRAAGRTVINLGWQGWDKQDEKPETGKNDEENEESAGETRDVQTLPLVRQGESGTVHPSLEKKTTGPPKSFTYHSLLAAMNGIHAYVKDPQIRAKLKEIQGIGTEATQEGILSTLFQRGYLEKKKKQILSTELGKLLINLLTNGEGKASVLARPDMTALWERTMTDIEAGSASLESFVSEVADMVKNIISDRLAVPAENVPLPKKKEKEASGETIEAPCPLGCGRQARRSEGKYGPYWRCSCSPVTFGDTDGVPVVRNARVEAKCPTKGCKGTAVRFVSKKGDRVFWKCDKCGEYFDDADGQPAIREKSEQHAKQAIA